jgi:DNA-binding beta-propeller fold protein YncE
MTGDSIFFVLADSVVKKGGNLGGTIDPTGIYLDQTDDFFNIIFCQERGPYYVQKVEGKSPYSVIPFTYTDIWSWYFLGIPKDLTSDEFRNIYVVDQSKNEILKFDKDGQFILSFGRFGPGYKEFKDPSGISYYDKTLYVADTGNNRILRFQLSTDIAK